MFYNIFFYKSCRLRDNVEKFHRAGQAIDGKMTHAHCMLDNQGYKHKLRICNMFCFSITTMHAAMLRYKHID